MPLPTTGVAAPLPHASAASGENRVCQGLLLGSRPRAERASESVRISGRDMGGKGRDAWEVEQGGAGQLQAQRLIDSPDQLDTDDRINSILGKGAR